MPQIARRGRYEHLKASLGGLNGRGVLKARHQEGLYILRHHLHAAEDVFAKEELERIVCGKVPCRDDPPLVVLLKDCADKRNLFGGVRLHADILKRGLLSQSTFVGNNLISMYVKCDDLASAQRVFCELPVRDVVSWNVLLSGLCQHEHNNDALYCVECMQGEGIFPDAVTFLGALKACGNIGSTHRGKFYHAEIARRGLLGDNVVLSNALVDMYAKCGAFNEARQVLREISVQNVISWTALITGYVQHGYGHEALDCFIQMQQKGLSPNAVTFPCIFKACGSVKAVKEGEILHAEVLKTGLLREDVVLGNALVDMYVKCGLLDNAHQVFESLPKRNVISWNTLLAGYSLYGNGEKVLFLYEHMTHKSLNCDIPSFICVLNACGTIRNLEKGKEVHAKLVRQGQLESSNVPGNALLDMYAKCGAIKEAEAVFDELQVKDVISYTALIVGYYQHELAVNALQCFERMKHEGFTPDAVTFSCILKACGSIGAMERGKEIHSELAADGFLGDVTLVGAALVEMYAECGALSKVQEVFDELPVHDVMTWNALIAAYAQSGHHDIAFSFFLKFLADGMQPKSSTFFVLLNACSGLGMASVGQIYYNMMYSEFCIMPTVEHHNWMVYLMGLSGQFNEAIALIKKLPSSHRFFLWCGLLSACQPCGNERFAEVAFENSGKH